MVGREGSAVRPEPRLLRLDLGDDRDRGRADGHCAPRNRHPARGFLAGARRVPPGKHGIKLRLLRDLARQRGLEAFAIRATLDDLHNELSKGRPVLLGLILPHENDRSRSHYEVAIALNTTDGTLITIDPATGGWMRRTPQVLDIEWKPAGYVALVVTGDKSRTDVGDAR